jgi:hypothetical protein
MPIDLGDIPTGTEPTTAEQLQIRTAIGLGQTDAPTFGQFITLSDATNFTYVNFGGSNQIQRESSLMWFSSAGSRELGFTIDGPIRLRQGGGISWWSDIRSGTLKASIFSTADNIIEQRNGTAKQTLRIYNTYTSATVYERAVMDYNGPTPNTLRIGTEFLGSGMAANPVDFVVGGVARMSIAATGEISTGTNRIGPAVGGLVNNGGALGLYFGYSGSNPGFTIASAQIIMTAPIFKFNGLDATFPALKRSTTRLQAVLADDSTFTNIQGKLTTDTAYTGTVVVPTGFLTLYDSTGTAYRVPCVV